MYDLCPPLTAHKYTSEFRPKGFVKSLLSRAFVEVKKMFAASSEVQ